MQNKSKMQSFVNFLINHLYEDDKYLNEYLILVILLQNYLLLERDLDDFVINIHLQSS